MTSNGQIDQSTEEAIRIEAYLLSEKAGHPAGSQHIFWTEAELIVLGRNGNFAQPAAPKLKAKKSGTVEAPAPVAEKVAKARSEKAGKSAKKKKG